MPVVELLDETVVHPVGAAADRGRLVIESIQQQEADLVAEEIDRSGADCLAHPGQVVGGPAQREGRVGLVLQVCGGKERMEIMGPLGTHVPDQVDHAAGVQLLAARDAECGDSER